MQINKLFRAGLVTLVLVFSMSVRAEVIVLDTWNVTDIQSTGDIVEIIVGTTEIDGELVSTLTFQWQEGDTTDDLTTATALDQIYFNVLEALDTWNIVGVLQNGLDDIANWSFAVGGTNSGAGGIFGTFSSKANKESPADDGGIEPNSTMFIFDSVVTLTNNSEGAKLSAHVRYGDSNCSGWVSNPEWVSPDQVGEGSCAKPVPEPGPLALLGLGLLGMGLARRRKS